MNIEPNLTQRPDLKVEYELVTISYDKFYLLVIAEFFATMIFTIIIWQKNENHYLIIAWLALNLFLNYFLRSFILLYYYVQKEKSVIHRHSFWKYYFYVIGIQSGLLWALGGALSFYIMEPIYYVTALLFLIGVLSAPSTKIFTFPICFLGYMVPICFAILAMAVNTPPTVARILFVTCLLYVMIVIYNTIYAHILIKNAIKNKIMNDDFSKQLRESETNFKTIIENAPIGMAITSIDGKHELTNHVIQEILGYTNEEMCNLTRKDIVHPDDLQSINELLNKLVTGDIQVARYTKRYITKSKNIIWANISQSCVHDQNGKPLRFIMQIIDDSMRLANENKISELNKTIVNSLQEITAMEQEENELNKLYKELQICNSVSEAYPRLKIAAMDLFPQFSGALSIFNKSENVLETVIQWGDNQIISDRFMTFDCFGIREGVFNVVNEPSKTIPCAHYISPPQVSYMGFPLIIQDGLLGVIHFLAPPHHIITKHQQELALSFGNMVKLSLINIKLRSILQEQSILDPQTYVYKQEFFDEHFTANLSHLSENESICVALIELDNFKKFNEAYGHAAGDEMLKLIGTILNENIKSPDKAYRYGGKIFLLMINSSLENTLTRIEDLKDKIKHKALFYNNEYLPNITCSIGLAEAPKDGKLTDEIINAAYKALNFTKKIGKDKVTVYDAKLIVNTSSEQQR